MTTYYGLLSGEMGHFAGQVQPVEAKSPGEAMRAVRKLWGPQSCGLLALDQAGAPDDKLCRDAGVIWKPLGGPEWEKIFGGLDIEKTLGGLCRIGSGRDGFTLASGGIWQNWVRGNRNRMRPCIKAQWFAREETAR